MAVSAENGGVSRGFAVGLVVAAVLGIAVIMGGLLLLLDPGGPTEIGPAGDAAAVDSHPSPGSVAASPEGASGQPSAGSADGEPAVSMAKSVPTRVRIPKIGVNAPVGSVGLSRDGFLEVPPLAKPNLTGWYRLGPAPGQLGPAVIVGHVNNKAGPAVFSRLSRLAKGDKVEVDRRDGKVAAFTVDKVERVAKRSFPTGRVYGNLPFAGLRLITCGGAFDGKTGSYDDNIIIYAILSGSR